MKHIISIALLLLVGCAGSPLKTGIESDQNRMNMLDVQIGMRDSEVVNIMGQPYKKETKVIENEEYCIWYYVTEPVSLAQSRYISDNFTPLIFKDNILKGWGYQYYNYLLDIDNARKKAQEEKRQKYTEDPEEWPPKESHKIIDMGKKKGEEKQPPAFKQAIESILEDRKGAPPPVEEQKISPKEKQLEEQELEKLKEKGANLVPEKKKEPVTTKQPKAEPQSEEEIIPQCKDRDKEHPNYHWLD